MPFFSLDLSFFGYMVIKRIALRPGRFFASVRAGSFLNPDDGYAP
jgi:hypothetical protein